MLRCATIGSLLGAIPGMGAAVINSESSNNAKEGGALIPTIAFGVPGSASMALILGAFLIHGLVPGPEMLTKRLDITYTLVWSVAIANILGAGICFLFANQLAKIALVRIGVLAPVVIAITYIGAFQGQKAWGDIYALLIFGFVGWVMKRFRWPRPPLILGFVLGALVERYMFISVERYGWEWLWIIREGKFSPWVDIVFVMTLYGVLSPIVRGYIKRAKSGTGGASRFGFQRQSLNPDTCFALMILAGFVICLYVASGWEFGARLVPQVVGYAGVLFVGWHVLSVLFLAPPQAIVAGENNESEPSTEAQTTTPVHAYKIKQEEDHFDIQADYGDLDVPTIFKRATSYFGWLLFFFGAASVVGLLPAMFLFLVGYMRFEGKESWKLTLGIAIPMWLLSYGLFHKILIVPWPQSLVGDWFPGLRSNIWTNLF